MADLDKIDKRFRNLSLVIIFISILLFVIWALLYLNSPENASPLLMAISIALLLAGILLFTRIQYVIWMKKRI